MSLKLLSRSLVVTGLMLVGLAAQAVEVEDAWIREAPPTAEMIGGFMTIKNGSDQDWILVGAHSDAIPHIMLHRTVHEGGMARMVHQKQVVIPAGGTVQFKPGDYHLMMKSPKPPLKAGDKVTITLEFKGGEEKDVVFTVKKMPMMMDHHGMGDMHHH